MNDYIGNTENIHNKLVELEDLSRRNNTRIDGKKEDSKRAGKNVIGGPISVERKVKHRECGDKTCA